MVYTHVKRTHKELYDLPNGNVSISFPRILGEVFALSVAYPEITTVKELISKLQAVCLENGVKPQTRKFTAREEQDIVNANRRAAVGMRKQQAQESREEEKKRMGATFPERTKIARNKLGDF